MTIRRTRARRAAAAAAVATALLGLAACGGKDSAAKPSGHASHSSHSDHDMSSMHASPDPSHNAQDVAFAQAMIPHHRQAVAMAELAPGRAQDQAVKDLAAKIKSAQDPEIATMSEWLTSWHEDVPAASAGDSGGSMAGMSGMDHSGGDMAGTAGMAGMMSDAEMATLKKLSGAAFDKAFLTMMIGHHRGAVAMARTEQAKGAYGPAGTMAAAIITGQSAEIARMNALLGK